MSTVNFQRIAPAGTIHPRALVSGALGVFSSLLAIAWARWGYNLPSAVNVSTQQSQNLMLIQLGIAFITLVGSGLMLARYTAPGGFLNILGAIGTFVVGVYYSNSIADVARASALTALPLHFSDYYTSTISIPTDRIFSTFVLVPVLPIALLLLISGLGALATYRSVRRLGM